MATCWASAVWVAARLGVDVASVVAVGVGVGVGVGMTVSVEVSVAVGIAMGVKVGVGNCPPSLSERTHRKPRP